MQRRSCDSRPSRQDMEGSAREGGGRGGDGGDDGHYLDFHLPADHRGPRWCRRSPRSPHSPQLPPEMAWARRIHPLALGFLLVILACSVSPAPVFGSEDIPLEPEEAIVGTANNLWDEVPPEFLNDMALGGGDEDIMSTIDREQRKATLTELYRQLKRKTLLTPLQTKEQIHQKMNELKNELKEKRAQSRGKKLKKIPKVEVKFPRGNPFLVEDPAPSGSVKKSAEDITEQPPSGGNRTLSVGDSETTESPVQDHVATTESPPLLDTQTDGIPAKYTQTQPNDTTDATLSQVTTAVPAVPAASEGGVVLPVHPTPASQLPVATVPSQARSGVIYYYPEEPTSTTEGPQEITTPRTYEEPAPEPGGHSSQDLQDDHFARGPPERPFAEGPPDGYFAQRPPEDYSVPGSPEGHITQGLAQGHLANGPPEGHFAQSPPDGHFAQGPPDGHFANGPPDGLFANGPPEGHFAQSPSDGHFAQGPPHGHFVQGPPHGHFVQGPPDGHFAHGHPDGQFAQGPPEDFARWPHQEQLPALNAPQGATGVFHSGAGLKPPSPPGEQGEGALIQPSGWSPHSPDSLANYAYEDSLFADPQVQEFPRPHSASRTDWSVPRPGALFQPDPAYLDQAGRRYEPYEQRGGDTRPEPFALTWPEMTQPDGGVRPPAHEAHYSQPEGHPGGFERAHSPAHFGPEIMPPPHMVHYGGEPEVLPGEVPRPHHHHLPPVSAEPHHPPRALVPTIYAGPYLEVIQGPAPPEEAREESDSYKLAAKLAEMFHPSSRDDGVLVSTTEDGEKTNPERDVARDEAFEKWKQALKRKKMKSSEAMKQKDSYFPASPASPYVKLGQAVPTLSQFEALMEAAREQASVTPAPSKSMQKRETTAPSARPTRRSPPSHFSADHNHDPYWPGSPPVMRRVAYVSAKPALPEPDLYPGAVDGEKFLAWPYQNSTQDDDEGVRGHPQSAGWELSLPASAPARSLMPLAGR